MSRGVHLFQSLLGVSFNELSADGWTMFSCGKIQDCAIICVVPRNWKHKDGTLGKLRWQWSHWNEPICVGRSWNSLSNFSVGQLFTNSAFKSKLVQIMGERLIPLFDSLRTNFSWKADLESYILKPFTWDSQYAPCKVTSSNRYWFAMGHDKGLSEFFECYMWRSIQEWTK